MAWQQYSHYHPHPQSYPQLYPQHDQYAHGYHQWYGYYQQQAAAQAQQQRQVAPIPHAPPAAAAAASSSTTTTTVTAPIPTVTQTPTTNTASFSQFDPTKPNPAFNTTFVQQSVGGVGSSSGGARGPRRQSQLKGLFSKELPKLMYGFGDDKQVANDSVAVMEEILIEYIVDVCQTALASTRRSRLHIEDLRRALSRPGNSKKLARMEELLFMQEDIKRARKQFEENEMGGGSDY